MIPTNCLGGVTIYKLLQERSVSCTASASVWSSLLPLALSPLVGIAVVFTAIIIIVVLMVVRSSSVTALFAGAERGPCRQKHNHFLFFVGMLPTA